jgi:hypothetical protein
VRFHPQVARILKEAVGETKLPVKVYAPNPTSARGFFPERNHPNLSIEFKPVGGGKHIELGSGRATHVQYSGEHFGGTSNQAEYATKKRCLIISAIGSNSGGRYTAVALDYISKNGGKLMGEGYFSWQGQRASGGTNDEIIDRFFAKMNSLFGLLNHRIPNRKADADLFRAAGLEVEEQPAEAIPDIIKDHPTLLPATKVLTALGAKLDTPPGITFEITKIPTDLGHQHVIQKALDDLKDAKLLDYDLAYQGPKISKITIMREGVDLDRKVAIIESMRNRDIIATANKGKYGNGLRIVCQGITFVTIEATDGSGSIAVAEGEKEFSLCDYEKGELVDKIRTLAGKVTRQGITETIREYAKPING